MAEDHEALRAQATGVGTGPTTARGLSPLTALSPALTAVLGVAVLGERPPRRQAYTE